MEVKILLVGQLTFNSKKIHQAALYHDLFVLKDWEYHRVICWRYKKSIFCLSNFSYLSNIKVKNKTKLIRGAFSDENLKKNKD